MWDFVLPLVAGLSQLALGAMGFRVSNKPVHRHRRLWEITFIVVGLIGFGATVWSGIRSAGVQQSIESGVDKLERKWGISKGIGPPTIAVDCHETTLPTSMPTGGLSFIDLRHVDGGADSIGLAGNMSQPGQPLTWPQDQLGFPVMRCDLSNEESYDLLSVYMPLYVKFNEPIVKASGNGSQVSPGNLVYNRIWPILIPKIDAGKTYSFYAYTSGKYMVYATFLEAAFNSLDTNKQEPLRLALINYQALSFEPKL